MNSAFTPAKYLIKAERALHAARLLNAAGEIEGACNRAYYAMYDAAHAALLADYTGEDITHEQVSNAVKKAETFVAAIRSLLSQSD